MIILAKVYLRDTNWLVADTLMPGNNTMHSVQMPAIHQVGTTQIVLTGARGGKG